MVSFAATRRDSRRREVRSDPGCRRFLRARDSVNYVAPQGVASCVELRDVWRRRRRGACWFATRRIVGLLSAIKSRRISFLFFMRARARNTRRMPRKVPARSASIVSRVRVGPGRRPSCRKLGQNEWDHVCW